MRSYRTIYYIPKRVIIIRSGKTSRGTLLSRNWSTSIRRKKNTTRWTIATGTWSLSLVRQTTPHWWNVPTNKYIVWTDSVKALTAEDKLGALQQKYDQSLQTIQEKDDKLSVKQYMIVGLITFVVIPYSRLTFLRIPFAALHRAEQELKKIIQTTKRDIANNKPNSSKTYRFRWSLPWTSLAHPPRNYRR